MILKWGGYEHDDNEVSFSVRISRATDSFQRIRASTVRFVIQGTIIGTSFSDLTDKLNTLESEYSTQGKDLVFYDNDGNETAHALRNSETLGGTRVVGFEYLEGIPGVWGSSTEYVNKRTYRIAVEGDIVTRGGLLEWEESYTYYGNGGPEHKWIESLVGDPQRQTLKQRTIGIGIQEGTAVGENGYPPLPEMLYPDLLMNIRGQSPMVRPVSPKGLWTGQYHVYAIGWRFIFMGPSALPGIPNRRY